MKVSIIIVHYRVQELLFNCLSSIFNSKQNIDFEVIVVDNDETKKIGKEIKKKFSKVRYIENGNKGYGAGNNLGASAAKGDFLFFLNPDTEIKDHTLDVLSNTLKQNKHIAAAAPLLYTPNGKIYPLQGTKQLTPFRALFVLSFINKLFPNNPISRDYWLLGWDKKQTKEVDVMPGTAFMMHREIFNKVKGFDERFFLFFEEYDLCKRIQKDGYSFAIVPQAQVVHVWGASTQKRKDIKDIFLQSKFLYFKKHYGRLAAHCIRLLTDTSTSNILFFFIFILAAFLRFYRVEDNFIFSGEVGHNLLAIKDAYVQRYISLIGPPTSHSWMYFGPLFYWLYAPVLILSRFNPISHAYFGVSAALAIVVLNYFVIKRLFNSRVALFSTAMITVSPLFLEFAREGRFFSIVTVLVYPLLLFLYNACNGEKKYLFWLAFIYGCMFSFHFTPIMLFPFIVSALLIKKIKLSLKDIRNTIIGFIIPLLPFILYDLINGAKMVQNMFLWIPYRIAGFLGLYPKNNVSKEVVQSNVSSLYNFLTKSFIFDRNDKVGFLIVVLLVTFLLYVAFTFVKKKRLSLNLQMVCLWLFWGYLAIFIHGSPPIHYFVPLLPVPIILFSLLLGRISMNKIGLLVSTVAIVIIGCLNMFYLIDSKWYFPRNDMVRQKPFYVPYGLQELVAKAIVNDAEGKRFVLQRVGPNDQFEGDYAQNYIYLLWLFGNEPVKNADIVYTIYEQPNRISNIKADVEKIHISNITITKKQQLFD